MVNQLPDKPSEAAVPLRSGDTVCKMRGAEIYQRVSGCRFDQKVKFVNVNTPRRKHCLRTRARDGTVVNDNPQPAATRQKELDRPDNRSWRPDDMVGLSKQIGVATLNTGLGVANTRDLAPAEVVKRYKSLADIERGFRVLKSEIEIGPVYHRLPDRIRAHERALANLRRIQHHRVTLNGADTIAGISTISDEQSSIFAALIIEKPTLNTQLTLL